jgi:ABC-2 type transport system ATP-binding protein
MKTETDSLLKIENLTIGYRRPLVENINLVVKRRQFVTIMGENGCGKSTLIETLLGTLQPLAGRIAFEAGLSLHTDRHAIFEKVGVVVSGKEQYPLGLQVQSLFEILASTYKSWNHQFCSDLIRDFKLDTTKKLRHLSLGEHSKVRLIKALSFEPNLLIVDELTANLSPSSKDSLVTAVLDLFDRKNMSILYISHSNEEAIKLSDCIYALESSGLRLVSGGNEHV